MICLCCHLPTLCSALYLEDRLFSFQVPDSRLVFISIHFPLLLFISTLLSAFQDIFQTHFFIRSCTFKTFLEGHCTFYPFYLFPFFVYLILFIDLIIHALIIQSHYLLFQVFPKCNQVPNLSIEFYFQATQD